MVRPSTIHPIGFRHSPQTRNPLRGHENAAQVRLHEKKLIYIDNIWYNHLMKSDIQYADEIYQIQGAIFAVYKEMGNAWHEEVYQQCLERELSSRGIPFDSKKELRIYYRGEPIEKIYIPDIVCYDKIILELKTVDHLTNEHKAQLLNYLRITGMTIGLLINFRAYPTVEILRMAN